MAAAAAAIAAAVSNTAATAAAAAVSVTTKHFRSTAVIALQCMRETVCVTEKKVACQIYAQQQLAVTEQTDMRKVGDAQGGGWDVVRALLCVNMATESGAVMMQAEEDGIQSRVDTANTAVQHQGHPCPNSRSRGSAFSCTACQRQQHTAQFAGRQQQQQQRALLRAGRLTASQQSNLRRRLRRPSAAVLG